jgi:hypothetical protein
MAPLILNLEIKWKSAIGRTLRPLFPRGENACTEAWLAPEPFWSFCRQIYHLHLPGLFSCYTEYVIPPAGNKRIVIEKVKSTASNSSSLFSSDTGTRAVRYLLRHRPWSCALRQRSTVRQTLLTRLFSLAVAVFIVLLGCQESRHAQHHRG